MLTLIGSGLTVLCQSLIAILEMFFWMHPKVYPRLFFDEETARKVAPIVRNVGLYNAFLAAGLIWGLLYRNDLLMFSLACVAIAGIFGAVTLKTRSPFPMTLLIQTLPAAIGLAGLWKLFG
ncbi:DUF1304 domain-containing protein [Paludisphaera rhizosphaerae]|uniref:DUF1304 domain-containing protein n=1 Tax=Paludisphaera rhizosphaerae TaxID=2711216 RepID=UPI0013EC1512|nr:DUF1304 domain-containing protein [Paludisphaera rhizosphaerae]